MGSGRLFYNILSQVAYQSLSLREAVHITNSSGMVEEEVFCHIEIASFRLTCFPKHKLCASKFNTRCGSLVPTQSM